jgi:hypothetical protein
MFSMTGRARKNRVSGGVSLSLAFLLLVASQAGSGEVTAERD